MSLRKKFFQTKNYHDLITAENALRGRDGSLPGLGLIFSPPGRGKTESIEHRYGEASIFYVKVNRVWGIRDLLEGICEEMAIEPEFRTVPRFKQVCRELKRRGEPLYIDEADYLLKNTGMLDVIRDIHDTAKTPVILVGMENICRKLQKYGQFWSRILPAAIVEFKPLTPPEMMLITQEWTCLELEAEAAETLCRHTEGDFRYLVGYLLELEKACSVNKTTSVSMKIADTVIKRLASKKEFAGRSDREDFKKVRVMGRTML